MLEFATFPAIIYEPLSGGVIHSIQSFKEKSVQSSYSDRFQKFELTLTVVYFL